MSQETEEALAFWSGIVALVAQAAALVFQIYVLGSFS